MEHIKEIHSTKILAHLEHKMQFFSELIHISFLWQASEQFLIPSQVLLKHIGLYCRKYIFIT